MDIQYKSTRGGGGSITASQAILKGLADDGGLFVPDRIPALDVKLEALSGLTYKETAYEVMKLFLTDFTEEPVIFWMFAQPDAGRRRYSIMPAEYRPLWKKSRITCIWM